MAAARLAAYSIGYGGTLIVTNCSGTLAAGNSFQLFVATNYSGLFTVTNLPTLPVNLAWTNTLGVDGKLSVISVGPPPQPYITSMSLSGTNLVIKGTNGLSGQQYVVLSSTNVALPLSQWTPIATNTFNGIGHFNITNGVDPGAPRNFYILRSP